MLCPRASLYKGLKHNGNLYKQARLKGNMDPILEILQRWNPWERDIYGGIRRETYLKKIMPYLSRKEIIVLKGIRRSGKSTIMKQLIAELIKEGIHKHQILYVNLEDYGFGSDLTLSLFDQINASYLSYTHNSKRTYFFIDEAQKIPSWEQWVRTQYDLGNDIKFIVSGSCSSLLSKELSTLLTGRNITFTVTPLSYKEYQTFRESGSFDDYASFGGFPEVVLEESEEKKRVLLQQYFEDILHKDIIDRHSIRNTKQLLDLAKYLVSASGSKLSVSKLSKVFGLSKDTLSLYISYMIDTHLFYEVTFFSYSAKVKHDVSKLPKLYCIDVGFVHTVATKANRGQIAENLTLIKILENYAEVQYWNDGTCEVDFIFAKEAINVTVAQIIPERENNGLEAFCKKFKGFHSSIVSYSVGEGIIPLTTFLER